MYRHTSVHSQTSTASQRDATRIARERLQECFGPARRATLCWFTVGEAATLWLWCESPRHPKPQARRKRCPEAARAPHASRRAARNRYINMPISDEELRRRTLVASGRYDELARLLQSVKLRKLLVALSKAGVEDATLDGVGLETLNEFDISAKNPGERILLSLIHI